MINNKSFLIILLFTSVNFGQVYVPKQITNFNFDSRNPSFLQYPLNLPGYNEESELFFEAVNDTVVSICSMKYNAQSDSFYQLTLISSYPIENSQVINRNANGKFVDAFSASPYKMLVWETNESGNWDIVFSVDSGDGWKPQELLFSSPEDELEPGFILDPAYFSYPDIKLLYRQSNSIFLFSKDDSDRNEMILEGNDSLHYYSPTGANSLYDNKIYVVAVEEKNGEKPHLVYRYKNYADTIWSEKKNIMVDAPASKPKFTFPDFETILSFEHYSNGKKKNLLIRPEDFNIAGTAFSLIEDSTFETSEFSSHTYFLITGQPGDDYYPYTPYTFRYRKNDSTFIRAGEYEYYQSYSDYYSRVVDTKPDVGPLSWIFEGAVAYTVWEDSSNNRINLFGVKRVDPLGTVKINSGVISNFKLFQNYPNPFNPTTKIKFTVPPNDKRKTSNVTLKIYDVLGKEVATLVNEEKPAGEYEVEFNPASGIRNPASGIYFYQLKAGSFVQTKKMILVK